MITGLDFPAAFTLTPGGRIFYGLRFTGEIRRFVPGQGDFHFFTVPGVVSEGEQGLLGLAVHPDYPRVLEVYAYVTRLDGGVARNEVVKITNVNGQGTSMQVIFSTTAARFHNGGRILFGPDRMLYIVVGENGQPANAQNLAVTTGKVLRVTPTGAVPADNPFAGSKVFSYGHRNSFGFDFDPRTGLLWETENGPECNDEINIAFRGRNHGWGPSETCTTPPPAPTNTNRDGPSPVVPRRFYNAVVAPTGAAFCDRCALGPESEGALFYGRLNTSELRRVVLGPQRLGVASESTVLTLGSPILSMEAGPAGALYFSTPGGIFRLTS